MWACLEINKQESRRSRIRVRQEYLLFMVFGDALGEQIFILQSWKIRDSFALCQIELSFAHMRFMRCLVETNFRQIPNEVSVSFYFRFKILLYNAVKSCTIPIIIHSRDSVRCSMVLKMASLIPVREIGFSKDSREDERFLQLTHFTTSAFSW